MSDSPVGFQAPAGAAGWQRSQGSSEEGKADRTYPREAGDDRCGTLSRGPNPPPDQASRPFRLHFQNANSNAKLRISRWQSQMIKSKRALLNTGNCWKLAPVRRPSLQTG